MNFRVKILAFVVVLSGANPQCFAKSMDGYPFTKSCYIQYLQEKGRLNGSLPSTVQPPLRCRLANKFLANIFIDSLARHHAAKVAVCLKNKLADGDYYDYVLKYYLYRDTFLQDAKTLSQFNETKRHLHDLETELRVKCKTDQTGADNKPTLVDHQLKYCMQQYALDNQIGKLSDDVDLNPNRIHTEGVNCTSFVADERSKTETQFKDQLSASDCVMNEFRSGAMFDWKVAAIGLYPIYIPTNNDEIKKMVEEYLLSKPTSECVL